MVTVQGVPSWVSRSEIALKFANYGAIPWCMVMNGCGVVRFLEKGSVAKAIAGENGTLWDGCMLGVQRCCQETDMEASTIIRQDSLTVALGADYLSSLNGMLAEEASTNAQSALDAMFARPVHIGVDNGPRGGTGGMEARTVSSSDWHKPAAVASEGGCSLTSQKSIGTTARQDMARMAALASYASGSPQGSPWAVSTAASPFSFRAGSSTGGSLPELPPSPMCAPCPADAVAEEDKMRELQRWVQEQEQQVQLSVRSQSDIHQQQQPHHHQQQQQLDRSQPPPPPPLVRVARPEQTPQQPPPPPSRQQQQHSQHQQQLNSTVNMGQPPRARRPSNLGAPGHHQRDTALQQQQQQQHQLLMERELRQSTGGLRIAVNGSDGYNGSNGSQPHSHALGYCSHQPQQQQQQQMPSNPVNALLLQLHVLLETAAADGIMDRAAAAAALQIAADGVHKAGAVRFQQQPYDIGRVSSGGGSAGDLTPRGGVRASSAAGAMPRQLQQQQQAADAPWIGAQQQPPPPPPLPSLPPAALHAAAQPTMAGGPQGVQLAVAAAAAPSPEFCGVRSSLVKLMLVAQRWLRCPSTMYFRDRLGPLRAMYDGMHDLSVVRKRQSCIAQSELRQQLLTDPRFTAALHSGCTLRNHIYSTSRRLLFMSNGGADSIPVDLFLGSMSNELFYLLKPALPQDTAELYGSGMPQDWLAVLVFTELAPVDPAPVGGPLQDSELAAIVGT